MNLHDFSTALYATPISTGIRETAGIIPTIQSIHIIAISVVVGSALVRRVLEGGGPDGAAELVSSFRTAIDAG